MTWALMTLAILIEAGATIALRLSGGWARPVWLVPAAVGYVVTFALVSVVLQRGWTLALTYGVWSAGGILLLALSGRILLGETLRWTAVAGLVLTICGIALIQHGSNSRQDAAAALDSPSSTTAGPASLEGMTDER